MAASRYTAHLVGHVEAQLGLIARLECGDVRGELLIRQHELLGVHVDVGVAAVAVSVPCHIPLHPPAPALAAAFAAAFAAALAAALAAAAAAARAAALAATLADADAVGPRVC